MSKDFIRLEKPLFTVAYEWSYPECFVEVAQKRWESVANVESWQSPYLSLVIMLGMSWLYLYVF